MKPKIPLVTIILIALIIIGGIFWMLKYSNKDTELSDKTSEFSRENFKDSDNDGLRDWEEELYRTNPFNPDTDGDGYLDGEEVDSGHNPLVKAPGDELGFYPLPLGEKYNLTNKILNEASIQKVVSSYLSQKIDYLEDHPEINDPNQFSALTDPSTIKEMARRSIGDNYDYLMEANEEYISELSEIFDISVADEQIKISEDNSQEAIKLYIFKISEWLNSDIFFFQSEALQIVSEASKTQNFSSLDKLIKLNDKWIDQMKETAVPSSWKEIHKEGLEMIILTRNIFVSLRDYENDPFKARYAIYEELGGITNDWTELIKKAINLAESQGIELSL